MTCSVALVIKRLPPSPDRLFLGRSLFREDFVDVVGKDGYRVRKAAEFHGHPAVSPNPSHAPSQADERAFGDLLNHQSYLARAAQEAR